MAPRTPEQQKAYNLKRRQENATKSAHGKTKAKAKPTKAEKEAKKATADKRLKGALVVHGATEAEATKVVEKRRKDKASEALAQRDKAKRDPATGAQVMTTDKRKVSKSSALAAPYGEPKHTIKGVPAAKASLALLSSEPEAIPHGAGAGAISGNGGPKLKTVTMGKTLPRSYYRSGKPGGGMLRGKAYQATVTFTKEQFNELFDKAQFNMRSLAEQIRWCVMQQLAVDHN